MPTTREWKDGIFSYTLRHLASLPNSVPKWIILDGDLDANWIESMNSLMDDNKLLTLANNDRIKMPPSMRLIFETATIEHASPATVSRAGVLWIPTTEGRNWKNVVAAWVRCQTRGEHVKDALHNLCDEFIPPVLEWVCGGGNPKGQSITVAAATTPANASMSHPACTSIGLTSIGLVQSFLDVLEGMMTDKNCAGADMGEVENNFRNTFVFVVLWTFGGCLAESSNGSSAGAMDKDSAKDRGKTRFDAWFRRAFASVRFPPRDTVHDYWLDPETNTFENWKVRSTVCLLYTSPSPRDRG